MPQRLRPRFFRLAKKPLNGLYWARWVLRSSPTIAVGAVSGGLFAASFRDRPVFFVVVFRVYGPLVALDRCRCIRLRPEWSVSKLWTRTVSPVWSRALVSPYPETRRSPRCCFESANANSSQFHGLLAIPIELLGFRRLHPLFMRLNQFLMFVPANSPPVAGILHTTTGERTCEAIVARALITQINGVLVPGSLPSFSAYVFQFFARRATIGLRFALPRERTFGQLRFPRRFFRGGREIVFLPRSIKRNAATLADGQIDGRGCIDCWRSTARWS